MNRILVLFLLLSFSIGSAFAQKNKKKDNAAFDAELDALVKEEVSFDIPIITGYQLKELQDKGEALIVLDARDKKDFDKKHIKNAKWIGEEDFSIERVWMIDQAKKVVIYGEMGGKTEEIAKQLEKVGFKKIYNLHGDLQEWAKYKYVVLED